MSVPTPVTNSTIVIESGSIRKATFTSRDGIHSNTTLVTERSSLSSPRSPTKVTRAARKAPPLARVPTTPACGSLSLDPTHSSTTKPRMGNAGIR